MMIAEENKSDSSSSSSYKKGKKGKKKRKKDKKKKKKKKMKKHFTVVEKKNDDKDTNEVSVIKQAIIKISALLLIGFGEAGGEIIKQNLSTYNDLNTRLKGKKKTCIFNFCDIRQFEEINLSLEEKTILLINEIAEIVHSSVDRFGGATNKNIGESFLNVWKFYNEVPIKDGKGNVIKTELKDNLLEVDLLIQKLKLLRMKVYVLVWDVLKRLINVKLFWNIEKMQRYWKEYRILNWIWDLDYI